MENSDIYYIDVNKIGRDFTGKKDVSLLTNDNAIAESIRNILNTKPGSRVMDPLFGTNLEQYLFSPIDPITSLQIQKTIEDAIEKFEPRVDDVNVNVVKNEDKQSYDVTITYKSILVRDNQTVSFQYQLKKVR
ncbi:hypothetical protein GW796_09390 [archaeon]|nr:hypothetical protein [archaeon]NCT58942.1 hypothetical protein [archaeon]